MLARHGIEPGWQPGPLDVIALARATVERLGRQPDPDYVTLSLQCGVKPPTPTQQHTALADARWAMRWYDALTAGIGG